MQLTGKKLRELFYEIFEDLCNTRFEQGSDVYIDDDGKVVFELIIKQDDDSTLEISYTPSPKYFVKEIMNIYDNQNFLAFLNSGGNISSELRDSFTELERQMEMLLLKQRLALLHKAFDATFRQSERTAMDLWGSWVDAYCLKAIDSMRRTSGTDWEESTEDYIVNKKRLKDQFAKKQKKAGEQLFEKAFNAFIDLPPKEFLFDEIYKNLHSQWEKAQKLYKDYKDIGDWRGAIAKLFNELPMDLIEKLNSLDATERRPGNIALAHTARVCGIQEHLSLEALHKKHQASKKWLKTANRYKIERMYNEYKFPASFQPDIIDEESKEPM